MSIVVSNVYPVTLWTFFYQKFDNIRSAVNEINYGDIHSIYGKGQWETLTGYLGPTKDKELSVFLPEERDSTVVMIYIYAPDFLCKLNTTKIKDISMQTNYVNVIGAVH